MFFISSVFSRPRKEKKPSHHENPFSLFITSVWLHGFNAEHRLPPLTFRVPRSWFVTSWKVELNVIIIIIIICHCPLRQTQIRVLSCTLKCLKKEKWKLSHWQTQICVLYFEVRVERGGGGKWSLNLEYQRSDRGSVEQCTTGQHLTLQHLKIGHSPCASAQKPAGTAGGAGYSWVREDGKTQMDWNGLFRLCVCLLCDPCWGLKIQTRNRGFSCW